VDQPASHGRCRRPHLDPAAGPLPHRQGASHLDAARQGRGASTPRPGAPPPPPLSGRSSRTSGRPDREPRLLPRVRVRQTDASTGGSARGRHPGSPPAPVDVRRSVGTEAAGRAVPRGPVGQVRPASKVLGGTPRRSGVSTAAGRGRRPRVAAWGSRSNNVASARSAACHLAVAVTFGRPSLSSCGHLAPRRLVGTGWLGAAAAGRRNAQWTTARTPPMRRGDHSGWRSSRSRAEEMAAKGESSVAHPRVVRQHARIEPVAVPTDPAISPNSWTALEKTAAMKTRDAVTKKDRRSTRGRPGRSRPSRAAIARRQAPTTTLAARIRGTPPATRKGPSHPWISGVRQHGEASTAPSSARVDGG